jgi:hypothetical protein
LGRALGLAEGKERGKESVAHENERLKATNEALHKHLCDTLEQSNGIARLATENMLATRTAADLVVKKTAAKKPNCSPGLLERTVADQKVELGALKQLTVGDGVGCTSVCQFHLLRLRKKYSSVCIAPKLFTLSQKTNTIMPASQLHNTNQPVLIFN